MEEMSKVLHVSTGDSHQDGDIIGVAVVSKSMERTASLSNVSSTPLDSPSLAGDDTFHRHHRLFR